MRPADLELWSKEQLIREIYNLQVKLKAYEGQPGEAHSFVIGLCNTFRLSLTEAKIVAILSDGRRRSRETIYDLLYFDNPTPPLMSMIGVYISKIRKKIRPHSFTISSGYGTGYVLIEPKRLRDFVDCRSIVEKRIQQSESRAH